MIITIHEGYDESYIILTSGDKRFREKYGKYVHVMANNVYKELEAIADLCNNELGDECLFEID